MNKLGKWNLDEDVDKMGNEVDDCIKGVVKVVLRESKGCAWLNKETWWWNTEVKHHLN